MIRMPWQPGISYDVEVASGVATLADGGMYGSPSFPVEGVPDGYHHVCHMKKQPSSYHRILMEELGRAVERQNQEVDNQALAETAGV